MNNAIEIQDVSKRFRLYRQKYSSLKERVLHAGHIPYEDFFALRNVDVAIRAGTTVGILGRNGSGKSTLLKCIAGILQPTSGQVVVRGQLAAMLELGAGFQPELSGRDNIYLNGSLLGLSRRDIDKRFDEIVEFAELEQFIDNQVKYYSSGMYVRLGFAVAVNVDPDVLLVDEVLAVGDERFQEKCLDRVAEFQAEGRTIVVVAHSPDLLRKVCDDILVLDRGMVVALDAPGEAIRAFRETLVNAGAMLGSEPEPSVSSVGVANNAPSPRRLVRITEVKADYPGSGERPYVISGESLSVHVTFEVAEAVTGARFCIYVLSDRGDIVFASETGSPGDGLALGAGKGTVVFDFDALPLLDGRFTINLDVRDQGGVVFDTCEAAAHFEVMNPGRSTGVVALPMRVEVTVPGGSPIQSAERAAL
jgi:ABC-2 type transport system ATP-binding protein